MKRRSSEKGLKAFPSEWNQQQNVHVCECVCVEVGNELEFNYVMEAREMFRFKAQVQGHDCHEGQ